MEKNIRKFNEIRESLRKTHDRLVLKKATRMWIEGSFKIHALNYWYYRWFTNEFELFLINSSFHSNQNKEDNPKSI